MRRKIIVLLLFMNEERERETGNKCGKLFENYIVNVTFPFSVDII